MTSIQRYEAWPQEWPYEDKDGDLVTYEDHKKIVEGLEAKMAKAAADLELAEKEIKNTVNGLDLAGIVSVFNAVRTIRSAIEELKGQDDE